MTGELAEKSTGSGESRRIPENPGEAHTPESRDRGVGMIWAKFAKINSRQICKNLPIAKIKAREMQRKAIQSDIEQNEIDERCSENSAIYIALQQDMDDLENKKHLDNEMPYLVMQWVGD